MNFPKALEPRVKFSSSYWSKNFLDLHRTLVKRGMQHLQLFEKVSCKPEKINQ
jgi:hypothetical protein